MKITYFLKLILLVLCITIIEIKCDAVCDLNTLKVELKQDLADNGMLDCLRVIEPPHSVEESESQKNLRLAAQWDTSCAFESTANWQEMIRKKFDITQLVDSVGEPVKQDFEDQADLCEIIRAALAKNLFSLQGLNMQKLPMELIDKIDCAGVISSQKVGPRICAATGGSYFQKDSWTIFLDTAFIKLGGKPEFTVADTPEQPSNPYSDASNPAIQNKLIRDLMKFTPEQLENKEGELANMIDKAEENENSVIFF